MATTMVSDEGRRPSRARAEGDSQPVSSLRTAETILAVAQAAGARHQDALVASKSLVDAMSALVQSKQAAFASSNATVSELVKAHLELSGDAAASKAQVAFATAAFQAGQNIAPVSTNPTLADPDLASRLLFTAAADASRQAARATVAEAFSDAANVARTGISRALEVTSALQQQCASLRQRLAQAEGKCFATESALNAHECEVVGLLRAVEHLSTLSADAEGLRSENQRLKGHLRRFESMLSPAQIAAAALPPNYQPPASFRAFQGNVPVILKKEVPSLFALRRMDSKELTLIEVLHEWIALGDEVGLLRDELAKANEASNRNAARIAELEVMVGDEQTRRVGAEEQLKQLLRRRIDSSTAKHELDQAQFRLSLALDEKVALAAAVHRVTMEKDQMHQRVTELQNRIDDLDAQLKNRNAIADEVSTLRLGYARSVEGLRRQLANAVTELNLSKEEKAALTTRLAAGEKALAAAAREGSAVKARLQDMEREAAENQRRLAAEVKRCAELERICAANANVAKKSEAKPSQSPAVSTRTTQNLSTTLANLSTEMAKVGSQFSVATEQIASLITMTANLQSPDLSALNEGLLLSAKAVDATLRDAEKLRADMAEGVVNDARRIDALSAELRDAVREIDHLKQQLAETQAWAERAAVHVTETVTGRTVAVEDAHCPYCELRATEAASDRAKADEATSVAASMENRAALLEAAVNESSDVITRKDVQIATLKRQLEWAHARLTAARGEANRLHAVRIELQRSLALTGPLASEDDAVNDANATTTTEDTGTPTAATEGVSNELRAILELLTNAVDQARQLSHHLEGEADASSIQGRPDNSDDADAEATPREAVGEQTAVSRTNLVQIVKALWAAAIATGSHAETTVTTVAPAQGHVYSEVDVATMVEQAKSEAAKEKAALANRLRDLERKAEENAKVIEAQTKLIQMYKPAPGAPPAADEKSAVQVELEGKVASLTRLVELLRQKIAVMEGANKQPHA